MSEAPVLVDPMGRPLDAKGNVIYPKLPLATYFANAGLSDADAIAVEREVMRRTRAKIIRKARTDDAGERFRYLNDWQHRERVNRELVGESLLEMGFNRAELREIERGTQLGLLPKDPTPPRAHVVGADGHERVWDVEQLEDRGPDGHKLVRLTDASTGEQTVA